MDLTENYLVICVRCSLFKLLVLCKQSTFYDYVAKRKNNCDKRTYSSAGIS